MDLDPTTIKYMIKAEMSADGVVEKPDVIGAIFGQTEGLLGDELDLRDLQKSGRIGRIEVTADSKKGKTKGEIHLPSSLDKVETAILAAALESIDRIGPCKAEVKVKAIDDVRKTKRDAVMERAKQLLQRIADEGKGESGDIIHAVKETVRIEEIVSYGSERLPAGPNVSTSDAILVVEGRNDVANLLKHGIKNAIAVEGTSVPKTVADLSKEKVVTAFVDGDRGGELLLKELLQVAEIDFVARAPTACEVEELTQKQIMKSLRNKLPAEQFLKDFGIESSGKPSAKKQKARQEARESAKQESPQERPQREERPKGRRERPKPRSREERKGPEERRGGRSDRREDDRRSERRPDRRDDRKEERAPEERAPPTQREGPLATYRSQLEGLSGKLQGVLIDDKGKVVKGPLPVRDLADTLKKEGDGIAAVVFDGVITQRLLDIAVDKKIETIVGVKLGNITKRPTEVQVFTRKDL